MSNDPRPLNAVLEELFATLRAAPQSTCERCGAKFGPTPAPLCWDCESAAVREEERRRAAVADLAAVDRRFAGVSFEGYRCPPGDAEAKRLVVEWKPRRGLYLYGRPGCGKSHLAFAAAKALIAAGHRVFASEWTDLLHRLKATFDGRSNETTTDVLTAIERADVVLIDDLMTGKPTEWAVEQCWSVVQSRYQAEAPLLVTSNYTLGELSQRIGGIDGERIVSRLAEMADRVRVDAGDFRMGASR